MSMIYAAFTDMSKVTYICVKSDIRMCPKRLTYVSKEYTQFAWVVLHEKFALRDINMSKETYICVKRDPHARRRSTQKSLRCCIRSLRCVI